MFLLRLLTSLESASDSLVESSGTPASNPSFWDRWGMMIILGGVFLLLILGMWWSSRKRKKQQEETMEKLNTLKPGVKIETIGGVFGTIVEMNQEEGTFVLETGSEKHGKTYIRFDRNAIARIEPTSVPVEPVAPVAPVADEAPEFEPVADEAEEKAPEKEENKD